MKKNLEKRIKEYLKCEKLLHKIFEETDFCYKHCISSEKSLFIEDYEGYLGCCMYDNYKSDEYPLKEELHKKRVEKYGEPEKGLEECNYHSDKGCILEDYKPPVCIAHVCPDLKKYLNEEYGLDYNKDKIRRFLDNVLSGEASKKEISNFKKESKMAMKLLKSKLFQKEI